MGMLTDKVSSGEKAVAAISCNVANIERDQASSWDMISSMQLRMEDMEDRSRRSNLRLRGLPEPEEREDLHEMVRDIFSNVLDSSISKPVLIDRVHRAQGPKLADPKRPRDVICQIQYFSQKEEEILRKAWSKRNN